jgi:transposase
MDRRPKRKSDPLRQEGMSQNVCAISWKAQLRLCNRYKRLLERGKANQLIITAIAREFCGFMWAIANEVETPSA